MALVHCDFYSNILKLSSSLCVILPDLPPTTVTKTKTSKTTNYKTLYLLHGLSDDHTMWQRRTSIERYATELNLAVVMPAVNRSFYTDMVSGLRYWTYVSEEVPAVARSYFPLSAKREDNFVAGLSMGGYGALKMALRCPETFCAAGSFSGAVDIVNLFTLRKEHHSDFVNIFGNPDQVSGSDNDLYYLAKNLVNSGKPRPRVFQCCGTKDVLLHINRKFKSFAEDIGLDITYEEGRAGHEWSYWDKKIQTFLEWLQLPNPTAGR